MTDPIFIPEKDMPLITLSDHSSGFIEWIIKFKTRGFYNHIMWLWRPGFFASQGNTYSEAEVDRYTKKGNRLKFVEIINLTSVQKEIIKTSIRKKLKLPWWKKMYDWPGIVGQALGAKWFNIGGLNYCSEDFVSHLIPLIEYVEGDLGEALSMLPLHGSPEDLNIYFKDHPEVFKIYGKWDSDEK